VSVDEIAMAVIMCMVPFLFAFVTIREVAS
jgi:hypothetical protein